MNRRYFLNKAAIPFLLLPGKSWPAGDMPKKLITPDVLKSGDQVGLITPGFRVDEEGMERALKQIESLGLKPILGKNANKAFGYLAGTDAERAADVMDMFRNPAIKGIWCIRGGYGCARILDLLDYKVIRKHPKVLMGYSDITALHLALYEKAGLTSFHGPVASSEWTPYALSHIQSQLFGSDQTAHVITVNPEQREDEDEAFTPYNIFPGNATGSLIGGNLSLLASLVGTPYLPSFKGKIVFIEDVGERPYRIDRMMVQMLQGSDLRQAAGIALGCFVDCKNRPDTPSEATFSIHQVFEQLLKPLKIPTCYGLSIGHFDGQCTVPVGKAVQLDATQFLIQELV